LCLQMRSLLRPGSPLSSGFFSKSALNPKQSILFYGRMTGGRTHEAERSLSQRPVALYSQAATAHAGVRPRKRGKDDNGHAHYYHQNYSRHPQEFLAEVQAEPSVPGNRRERNDCLVCCALSNTGPEILVFGLFARRDRPLATMMLVDWFSSLYRAARRAGSPRLAKSIRSKTKGLGFPPANYLITGMLGQRN